MNIDDDFGRIEFTIADLVKQCGLSKSKIALKSETQRTQLGDYIKGEIKRIDVAVLCRLCFAFGCGVADILRYIPPESGTLDLLRKGALK